MTPENPTLPTSETEAKQPSAVLPELPPLTAEELDELAPLECCPGCLTHPQNR